MLVTQTQTDPPIFETEQLRIQPYAHGIELRMYVARKDQVFPSEADMSEAQQVLLFVIQDAKGNA